MIDQEAIMKRITEIERRVADETGIINGVSLLILMFILCSDTLDIFLENIDELVATLPENQQKTCRIIAEELQKDNPFNNDKTKV